MSSESRKSIRVEFVSQSEISASHTSSWNVAAACIVPLHDVFVATEEVVVTVDLPYVDQKRVRLECPTNDVVEVYAETTRKITFKDLGMKHRHGEFTCYHTRIRIPVPVDENKISSKFKRGLLEVRIPRLR